MPKIRPPSESALVMTVNQFCEMFAIGRDAFYSEVNAGRLRVAKIGARTLVAKAEAARWFAAAQGEGTSHV